MWKASFIFSTKNIAVFGYKSVKHLTSWPLNGLIKLTMLWTTGPKVVYAMGKCQISLIHVLQKLQPSMFPEQSSKSVETSCVAAKVSDQTT